MKLKRLFAVGVHAVGDRTRGRALVKGWCMWLVLILFTIFMAGCMSPSMFLYNYTTTNVTSDKNYWGRYKPGGEYVLQQDTFIMSFSGGWGELFTAEQQTAYSSGYSSATEEYTIPSLEEYREAPGKRPYIIGLLPKGSRIRVVKFELITLASDFTQLHIHAQPIDGQFKGWDMEICNLSGGTLPAQTSNGLEYAPSPRPEYLKEAENSGTTTAPATTKP